MSSVAKAARIEVVVVPMLAPRVIGYILSRPITPTPTKGVRADVKIELDCTRKVNPVPTRIATYPVRYDQRPGKS